MSVQNQDRAKDEAGRATQAERPSARKSPSRAGLILASLVAFSPFVEGGCSEAENAKGAVTLTCKSMDSKPQVKVDIGPIPITATVTGRCDENGVEEVDVSMPCGSTPAQQRCTLTLPVPSKVSFKRGRDAAPLKITVEERDGSAIVAMD